jgi:hypothetical protein
MRKIARNLTTDGHATSGPTDRPSQPVRPRHGTLPRLAVLFATLVAAQLRASTAVAQPPQQSYADYYTRQIQDYRLPSSNPSTYIANTYFLHNPTISPYLNLLRNTPSSGLPNYQTYVVPEQQRRAALQQQQAHRPTVAPRPVAPTSYYSRGTGSATGTNPYAGTNPYPSSSTGQSGSSYYNHWYGDNPARR